MAKTISELRNQSIQVRDASAAGENTATRVGTVLNDIVGHIEDYENTQSSNNSSQDTKIEGVKSSLNAEIARAKTEESNLSTQIDTERTERQSAVSREETARIQAVNDEKTAREQADNAEQDARIKADNDEKTARENADITLRSMIQTEVSNRQIAVKQEEIRAMAAEKANTQAITDENARAMAAEEAETARAKAEEERLQREIDNTNTNVETLDNKVNSNHDHLTDEVARLDTTDNEIKANLAAETARAQAAEEANAQAIETNAQAIMNEVARAQEAELANTTAIAKNTEDIAKNADKISELTGIKGDASLKSGINEGIVTVNIEKGNHYYFHAEKKSENDNDNLFMGLKDKDGNTLFSGVHLENGIADYMYFAENDFPEAAVYCSNYGEVVTVVEVHIDSNKSVNSLSKRADKNTIVSTIAHGFAYFSDGQKPEIVSNGAAGELGDVSVTMPNATLSIFSDGIYKTKSVTNENTWSLGNKSSLVLRDDNFSVIPSNDIQATDIELLSNKNNSLSGVLEGYYYNNKFHNIESDVKTKYTELSDRQKKTDGFVNSILDVVGIHLASEKRLDGGINYNILNFDIKKGITYYVSVENISDEISDNLFAGLRTADGVNVVEGQHLVDSKVEFTYTPDKDYNGVGAYVSNYGSNQPTVKIVITDSNNIDILKDRVERLEDKVFGIKKEATRECKEQRNSNIINFDVEAGKKYHVSIVKTSDESSYDLYAGISTQSGDLLIDSQHLVNNGVEFVYDANENYTNVGIYISNYGSSTPTIKATLTVIDDITILDSKVGNLDRRVYAIEGQLADNILTRCKSQIENVYACADFNRYNGHKNFALLMCTDIHQDEQRFKNALYLLDNCDAITAGVFLGDMNGHSGEDAFARNVAVPLINACTKEMMCCIGNHDQRMYVDDTISVEQSVANFLGLTKEYSHYTSRGYGYADYDNVRLIVLNPYDYSEDKNEDGTFCQYGDTPMFQQAQIDWLVQTLSSTPSGTTVIIASHFIEPCTADNNIINVHEGAKNVAYGESSGHRGSNGFQSGSVISDIVQAFIDKTSITKEYTYHNVGTLIAPSASMSQKISVNADFSNAGGLFACFIFGHIHHQFAGNLDANNSQFAYGNDTSYCIVDGSNWPIMYSLIPRQDGMQSQDLVTILCLDTVNKVINFVRVGASRTMFGEDCSVVSVKY